MLRFFIVFIVLQLTLFGLNMLNVVQETIILPWTSLLAQICAYLVTAFDSGAMASGKVLWNPENGFGVSIEAGCNGVEACIVLFAAIMAYPSSWRAKLVGILIGFFAIQAVNVVRVISLFYLGQWNDDVFRFAHEYLWQALIMIDVLIVWLLWVRSVHRRSGDDQGPPDDGPTGSQPVVSKEALAHA